LKISVILAQIDAIWGYLWRYCSIQAAGIWDTFLVKMQHFLLRILTDSQFFAVVNVMPSWLARQYHSFRRHGAASLWSIPPGADESDVSGKHSDDYTAN